MNKRAVFEQLLGDHAVVHVGLRPNADGVRLPAELLNEKSLTLHFGLNLVVPIPDLRAEPEGVYATLSFKRTPFPCFVPWSAVYAFNADDVVTVVWPNDAPDGRATMKRVAPKPPPVPSRGHLRSVD